MTDKAIVLQNCNQEFVKSIEQLKKKKMKIENDISEDEKNKEIIAAQIRALQKKLEEIEGQIGRKKLVHAKIEDILSQSEMGLTKIIDSFQVLLNFATTSSKTEET